MPSGRQFAHAPWEMQMATLGYPERYVLACEFIQAAPQVPGAKLLGQDVQLLLYSLRQQVAEGPCKASNNSSWGWNVVSITSDRVVEAWGLKDNPSTVADPDQGIACEIPQLAVSSPRCLQGQNEM